MLLCDGVKDADRARALQSALTSRRTEFVVELAHLRSRSLEGHSQRFCDLRHGVSRVQPGKDVVLTLGQDGGVHVVHGIAAGDDGAVGIPGAHLVEQSAAQHRRKLPAGSSWLPKKREEHAPILDVVSGMPLRVDSEENLRLFIADGDGGGSILGEATDLPVQPGEDLFIDVLAESSLITLQEETRGREPAQARARCGRSPTP